MIILIVVIIIVLFLIFFGKNIQNKEDQSILKIEPNHPSKLNKSIFPVGSGKCNARNNDRHIWHYSEYLNDIPYNRTCTYCKIKEEKLMTNNSWRRIF